MKSTFTYHFFRTAVIFAISFAILAGVYTILQRDGISPWLKISAVIGLAILLFALLKSNMMFNFAGFCMLMLALNYVFADERISPIWKAVATFAVLLQFGRLEHTIPGRIENDEKGV